MKKYDKEIIQVQLDHEKEVIEELKKMYEEAERQIDEKVQMLMTDELTQSKIYQIAYQKALKGQIGAILDNMNSNNYDSIQSYLKNSYEDGYIGTMYSLQQQGIPLIMPINQEQVVKAIQLDSKLSGTLYEAMGVNTNELKKSIRNEVSRGISNAYSYQDIARNVNNSMGIGLNKSIRIARTEGHRVNQQSTYDAMDKAKKKGANIVKQWDATLDAKTRTSHQRVDGEIRELDETFSNGLRFPGDPQGSAAEVINCRCVLLQRARWALDDDELKTLQERANYFGLDKTDSFNDYKSKYLSASTSATMDTNSGTINLPSGNFTSATSVKEAEEYAKNTLGIKNVSYKGNDLTTANEWNKGLTDSFDRFPELKKSFGFTGDCRERNKALKPAVEQYYMDWYLKNNPQYTQAQLQPYIDKKVKKFMRGMSVSTNTLAQSWISPLPDFDDFSGITVNGNYGKDSASFVQSLIATVKSKFHPEGCDTIRSVLDHEIGHQLDKLLDIRNNKDIQDLFNSRTHSELTDALSQYAWDNTNPNKYSEMIAEGWAEYCNNPNPRDVAKKIGETIINEYNKKFGGNP